jgi:hypothetical protein
MAEKSIDTLRSLIDGDSLIEICSPLKLLYRFPLSTRID